MGLALIYLSVNGPEKIEARIDFRFPATLIRGPSDTGKSYIRDCLWYLLGGEKIPKDIPQAFGYDSATLVIEADKKQYEIHRGLVGGDASVNLMQVADGGITREPVDLDPSSLLVNLSGAQGKQILRSKSKRGGVTGGDLRHWFLLSQPNMISEDATCGIGVNAPQRSAAFYLFITGTDDSAVELDKTKDELAKISGQVLAAEQNLKRVRADIPDDQERSDVSESLKRVDFALNAMTQYYEVRSTALKEVRSKIHDRVMLLKRSQDAYDHCYAMIGRFQLLDMKYISDSERLGAAWEGMSMFQALDKTPCPLCRSHTENRPDLLSLQSDTPENYSQALRAELEKISILRQGLNQALIREKKRALALQDQINILHSNMLLLEKTEQDQLCSIQYEFSGDPKTLAIRRSELSELLNRFDEESRLIAEIDKLTLTKKRKFSPLHRNVGNADTEVALIAKSYLHAWGFSDIDSVSLDTNACDLKIDGRPRLGFGAGKRALFLAALTIAIMDYALRKKYPHLGFVVIDSPLKSYADPKTKEQNDVEAGTVTNRFYDWLSKWTGPGQIIILENEEIQESAKNLLQPIEFTGVGESEGRCGFYPN